MKPTLDTASQWITLNIDHRGIADVVSRHPGLTIVPGRDGAGHHVGDPGSVEAAGNELQDRELIKHLRLP